MLLRDTEATLTGHSTNALSDYYMSGTFQGTRDTAVNKTDKNICPHGFFFSSTVRQEIKYILKFKSRLQIVVWSALQKQKTRRLTGGYKC